MAWNTAGFLSPEISQLYMQGKTVLHCHTEYHHGVGGILGMDGFGLLQDGFSLLFRKARLSDLLQII